MLVHVNTQRLLELYYQGQDRQHWYHDARHEIIELSLKTSRSEGEIADLLSLYSPRCAVVRSVRHTLRHIHGLPMAKDVTKSTRVAIANWTLTGHINGPKTSRFSACLKGCEQAVVLDVWMAQAMGVDQRLFRPRSYALYSKIIEDLAHSVGTSPAQCQAAVWHAVVTNAGVSPGSIKLIDELNHPERWNQ